MSVFSKETLLKEVPADLTRVVRFNHPTEGPGEVVIKRVASLSEAERINAGVNHFIKLRAQGEPAYSKFSNDALTYAVYLENFVVEPKLTFDEWLHTTETLGPVVTYLFGEVMNFSGMSEPMGEGGAAELEQKPFPADDAGGVPGKVGKTPD